MAGNVFSSIALSSSSGGSATSCAITLRYGSSYCKFAIRVDGQIRSALHSHPMSRGSSSDGGGSAKTPLQHFSKHFCSNSPHFEVVDNVCLIELLCKSQRLPRRAQDEEITIWARHSGFPRTTFRGPQESMRAYVAQTTTNFLATDSFGCGGRLFC